EEAGQKQNQRRVAAHRGSQRTGRAKGRWNHFPGPEALVNGHGKNAPGSGSASGVTGVVCFRGPHWIPSTARHGKGRESIAPDAPGSSLARGTYCRTSHDFFISEAP